MRIIRRSRVTPEQAIERIDEAFEVESSGASSDFPGAVENVSPDAQVTISQTDMAELLNERDREQLKQLKQVTRHTDDIHDLRKEYVPKLFLMIVGWLIFVGFIVFMVAIKSMELPEAVLIALITTATATVLGVFVIVAKWLFPSH